MNQSCKRCAWFEVCIDPCAGECPNLLGGEDCCQQEQGSYECQKIIGIVCSSFELPTDDTKRQVDRAKQL
jgi:hypothetical protein